MLNSTNVFNVCGHFHFSHSRNLNKFKEEGAESLSDAEKRVVSRALNKVIS